MSLLDGVEFALRPACAVCLMLEQFASGDDAYAVATLVLFKLVRHNSISADSRICHLSLSATRLALSHADHHATGLSRCASPYAGGTPA